MITQIPSMQLPYLNIFHAVSPGYWQGTTMFAFIPQLETEARTIVAALLLYLQQQHGYGVFKFFTSSAGGWALKCEWDPITNQLILPSNQAVQEATKLDEDYHFEAQVETVMPTTVPAPTGETAAFTQDSNLVSTFQPVHQKAIDKQQPSASKAQHKPPKGLNIPQHVNPVTHKQTLTTNLEDHTLVFWQWTHWSQR